MNLAKQWLKGISDHICVINTGTGNNWGSSAGGWKSDSADQGMRESVMGDKVILIYSQKSIQVWIQTSAATNDEYEK